MTLPFHKSQLHFLMLHKLCRIQYLSDQTAIWSKLWKHKAPAWTRWVWKTEASDGPDFWHNEKGHIMTIEIKWRYLGLQKWSRVTSWSRLFNIKKITKKSWPSDHFAHVCLGDIKIVFNIQDIGILPNEISDMVIGTVKPVGSVVFENFSHSWYWLKASWYKWLH